MPARTWWLVAVVLLAPLALLPASSGVTLMQAKNVGFIVLALSLIVWLTDSLWLQALAVWAVLSFVASGMSLWGIAGLLGVLAWLLIYGQAARLTETGWRSVRLAVLAAALFQVGWMVVQALERDPFFSRLSYIARPEPGPVDVVGWFANPTDTALYLGLSLPFLPAWASLLVGAAVLWWLRSTAGLVCVLVAWGFLAWRVLALRSPRLRRSALAAAAAALVLLAGVYVTRVDASGWGGRGPVWSQAIVLVRMAPVLGWGPNALGYRLRTIYIGERWEFLFNEWLQGAVELGLPGPGLAAGALGTLAWRARRAAPAPFWPLLLVGGLVSLFSIPLRIGPVALLLALGLGYTDGVLRRREGEA